MTDFSRMGVAAIRDGVANGEFKAVEVAEALNTRVANAKALNAFIVETPEKALEELMDERFGHHRSYYSNLAELVRDTDWKAFKEEFRRKRQAQGV